MIGRRPARAAAVVLAATALAFATAALTGCSAAGPQTTVAPPLRGALTSTPTPGPETYPDLLPTTGPTASSVPPDTEGAPVDAAGVAGLASAIDRAPHPSLAVCSGRYASVVAGRGDLLGTGGRSYLVDTTCAGSTGSSPDEVAIYTGAGATLARDLVVYAYSVNLPKITSYPYLDGPHVVVLVFADGAQFSLVGLSPTGIAQGPLENA